MTETGPAPYRHIACCVDDSYAARAAAAEAARLRDLGPGRLSLVHVIERPPLPALVAEGAAWYPDEREYESRARAWLADLARDFRAEPVLLTGYPPAAAAEWAERAGVDLLVAASHRGRVERLLLGSFASYLARHAPCAVLLVRPPAAAGGGEGVP